MLSLVFVLRLFSVWTGLCLSIGLTGAGLCLEPAVDSLKLPQAGVNVWPEADVWVGQFGMFCQVGETADFGVGQDVCLVFFVVEVGCLVEIEPERMVLGSAIFCFASDGSHVSGVVPSVGLGNPLVALL